MSEKGFFDRYPRFLPPNIQGPPRARLNRRYAALIESNIGVIDGRRVLDLASHAGRWSFAALAAGAVHVTGLEARKSHIEAAHEAMEDYGIRGDRYRMIKGDIHQLLGEFDEGSFDTVFCFGFLHHTAQHMSLLSSIAQLQPDDIIIDAAIDPDPRAIVALAKEDTSHGGYAAYGVESESEDLVIVGTPSVAALELMLRHVGYEPAEYFDWKTETLALGDLSSNLADYHDGRRVSLRARRMTTAT